MTTIDLLEPLSGNDARLYCVVSDGHEAKMSPDSSNPRHVWPWGKPLRLACMSFGGQHPASGRGTRKASTKGRCARASSSSSC